MTGPHRYERNLMSPAELRRLKAVDRAIHLAEATGAKPSAADLVADAEVIRRYITGAGTTVTTAIRIENPDAAVAAIEAAQRRAPKPGEHLRGIR
ncbi:hypothetical protein [Tsukamurella tyrosinosolvens]|uniref:hypothetical protein n=1 Tax=Tsukamurella tyrosinosolvens TaxID=57704 RepID=UPI002DD41E54|nr:hypothetical protein [Tsukamurella tyrosinosolvens]MEC4615823.1 hypothetical protein [Tsukamurella tyrosinosolvens]